jgi:hypothetical protein
LTDIAVARVARTTPNVRDTTERVQPGVAILSRNCHEKLLATQNEIQQHQLVFSSGRSWPSSLSWHAKTRLIEQKRKPTEVPTLAASKNLTEYRSNSSVHMVAGNVMDDGQRKRIQNEALSPSTGPTRMQTSMHHSAHGMQKRSKKVRQHPIVAGCTFLMANNTNNEQKLPPPIKSLLHHHPSNETSNLFHAAPAPIIPITEGGIEKSKSIPNIFKEIQSAWSSKAKKC